MNHHEHHFRNLGRARDHLTETILSLRSAVDVMTGDDWIDATELLQQISLDIGPRLARLRTAASERFDEYSRLHEFDAMRTGVLPFPDERAAQIAVGAPPAAGTAAPPPSLDAPNAKVGAALVARHGGIDQAMMAYQPDSAEFDHIQAYVYVSTGKRPKGWLPPIV
ncbi:MAG TPA: hypothetical protein VFN44_09035 [Solirubrobacteraceae bacterium]|nr:hypothetical protein [Solirubrobacteraceae bacterium]